MVTETAVKIRKMQTALEILRGCQGERGVWADPSRYKDQCWTRDLGLAIAPLLLQLGEHQIVRTHLENLFADQRPNGQIPILFLDNEERWLREKEERTRAEGRESFMLRRYHEDGLWNLTPGTRDSEIIAIIAAHEYAKAADDPGFLKRHRLHLEAALGYVEDSLMRDGVVIGCDWRDTMEKELGYESLLTNNCLLYHAYRLMDRMQHAQDLREAIMRVHWRKTTFIDYPGNQRFDPLGGAFSVLFNLAEPWMYDGLVAGFRSVDTPLGVSIRCRHNPTTEEEREVIERTDGVVVWPFIVGFSAMALMAMGQHDFATAQLAKLTGHVGFREWYDPATGKGYGANQQLWSATLYYRAVSMVEGL